jgi:hypothetical protein
MGPHPITEWDTFSVFVINTVRPLVEGFGSLSKLGDYTYFSFLGGLVSFICSLSLIIF